MATAKKSAKNIVSLKSEQDIAAQVETLRTDIAELAKAIKFQAEATAAEKTAAVKTTVLDTTETAAEKYRDLTQTAETSIKEKPLTSIAIAVGAGLLLGALTRR